MPPRWPAGGFAGAPLRAPTDCRAKRVGADRSAAETGDEDLDVEEAGGGDRGADGADEHAHHEHQDHDQVEL